jgi:hypothetical protein
MAAKSLRGISLSVQSILLAISAERRTSLGRFIKLAWFGTKELIPVWRIDR